MPGGGISEGLLMGGGSLLGGIAGGIGSSSAASQSAKASQQAAQMAQQQYMQTRADLFPYAQTGRNMLDPLANLSTAGPNAYGYNAVDQAAALGGPNAQLALEATPGYQFTLGQGLKATQANAAARGLGVSGAALKGAATYATGLADQTYSTRFKNLLDLNTAQQSNIQNSYNRMLQTASLGENAAAQTGTAGTNAANTAAQATQAAGQAQAAGSLGVGNAISGGLNNYLGYNMLQNLTGQTGGYSPTAKAVNAAIQPSDLGYK